MKNTKIEYSRINYIVLVSDSYMDDFDISIHSFKDIRSAKKWIKEDIKNFLVGIEQDETTIQSYDNRYWMYEDDDGEFKVNWEIRKIHNRTTGKWENPQYPVKWKKV